MRKLRPKKFRYFYSIKQPESTISNFQTLIEQDIPRTFQGSVVGLENNLRLVSSIHVPLIQGSIHFPTSTTPFQGGMSSGYQ